MAAQQETLILQQRACFNTLFNYIYKVSLNIPVRQPCCSAARRVFVASGCCQRTPQNTIHPVTQLTPPLLFYMCGKCRMSDYAPGTASARSLRSCSSYKLAYMMIWDIFLPWFLIKAKVDCCCQLRKQDCNDVPQVIAFISTFFYYFFWD